MSPILIIVIAIVLALLFLAFLIFVAPVGVETPEGFIATESQRSQSETDGGRAQAPLCSLRLCGKNKGANRKSHGASPGAAQ